ncbi:hypothetical protein SLEP1_g41356 [Rubroshorea leprosula]|uniref:BZIP domain-containing protein n=1 Tax=Rubroshorea leprosula TaxID=152421 RepID=A0AAV5L6A9_9ROSI|nr:hypothetical protein SLEP1_g41356 [Rubroshorea leprosula]
MGEKAILFQAVVPIGERRSMMNAWFKIQPTTGKISGPFHASQQPFRLGISSTIVSPSLRTNLLSLHTTPLSLYTIGGRVPNHFVLSDCISWVSFSRYFGFGNLSIYGQGVFKEWKTSKLPSPCVDSVLGVYGKYLCILPGVWKYGYYRIDEDEYLTNQKGYIWDTSENKCLETRIDPPKVEGEKWQWRRIRACAPLDGEGLLIAMDGEKNNFFLYNPENNDWQICNMKDPLPKFIGETSFAASGGKLYILEVPVKSPAFLYIYNINGGERRLEKDKIPILEFVDDLWSMDKWDRGVRLVHLADDMLGRSRRSRQSDKLCFLWLGPVSYENENGWPPVRTLHHLKIEVPFCSDQPTKVVDNKVFRTNITDLLDCLPCDPLMLETEADEVLIPRASGTTAAARENTLLFQAVVRSGQSDLTMNAWFKIKPTHEICGPFHVRQPFRLGMSSTFVGSSLYAIGGEVPSSRLCKSGYISWLDTRSPFNGWEVGELPSPCVDPVICVCGDFLYIFTELEGYIWDTRVNCFLATILLPRVVGGGERQWRRIRACAALDRQGLLIAMDGEKNNFFLYNPENNDWRIYNVKDPLPKFSGETSFAVSNGRLYILEVQVKFPVMLYIYDIMEGKLVKGKMPIPISSNDLLRLGEYYKITVCRLVPVANDKLFFLSLLRVFPSFSEGELGTTLLEYRKFKFSFNHNPSNSEVEVESCIEYSGYCSIANVTNLLDCLPCGPEQFEVEGKSPPDYLLTQLADPFHEQKGQITAEPETESSSEYSLSRGKMIREITAADEVEMRHILVAPRKHPSYRSYWIWEKEKERAKERKKKITAEPETEPSSEDSHSGGENIPEIPAAETDEEKRKRKMLKKAVANKNYRERIRKRAKLADKLESENEELREEIASQKLMVVDLTKRLAEEEKVDDPQNSFPMLLGVTEALTKMKEKKKKYKRRAAEADNIELENLQLRQEIASLKARMDELLKRPAGLEGAEEEQYAVGEKGKEQYKDTSANPVPPEASSRPHGTSPDKDSSDSEIYPETDSET